MAEPGELLFSPNISISAADVRHRCCRKLLHMQCSFPLLKCLLSSYHEPGSPKRFGLETHSVLTYAGTMREGRCPHTLEGYLITDCNDSMNHLDESMHVEITVQSLHKQGVCVPFHY